MMATLQVARRLFSANLEWSRSIALLALRRIGSRQADGEELRQVAAVRTWECALAFEPRRWPKPPQGDPFQLYAYQPVLGACLDAGLRANGRKQTQDGAWPQFAGIEAAAALPAVTALTGDDRLQSQSRRRVCLAVIADLVGEEREVITEHYLGGVSLTAIAERLGVSPASVSRIHARGLAQLREAMQRRGIQAVALL
jgi:RNA polymerase sigma factor (sigma-70 family)